jgi:hypothetical protein
MPARRKSCGRLHGAHPSRRFADTPLRLLLGGKGPNPDAVILAGRSLARRHIRRGKPVLDLGENCGRLVTVFKRAYLDLIDERFLGTLPLVGGLFRDDDAYRRDP